MSGVMDGVALCVACLQRHPVDMGEVTWLHNILYNALYRAAKRVRGDVSE